MHHDTTLTLNGYFDGTIEVNVTPDIRIRRHLHLDRDNGSQWVVYSDAFKGTEEEPEASLAEIRVTDPGIIRFLDALYLLIADPESFGKCRFDAVPDEEDAA